MQKKIVIVGGGVVETDNHKYYARSQLVEYLTGFFEYYSHVVWSARLASSHQYNISINGSKIDLNIINPNGETIFSLKGILGQLRNYCVFYHCLDKFTDLIVNDLSLTSLPYVLIGRLKGRRVVFYLGSDPRLTMHLRSDCFYGRFASLLNYLVLPLTLITANGVLVRGHSTLIQCLRWNKRTILSNPLISYKYFKKNMVDRTSLLLDGKLEILYVGKLNKNKGVQILIKALGILKKKHPGEKTFYLNIVGNGDMESELRAMVEKCGIADAVRFHGFINDPLVLASIFQSNSLLVVPTVYHEGFPRVIDEAMASGLPVVCSRLGGMKDGLKEDEVLFFEPGNAEELATAIEKIMVDEELRRKLQKSSTKRAKKILSQTASEQHALFLSSL